jgi:AcrR family transcriptional regulator
MIATDTIPGRILETAGQVFAEKGFKAATVREICRRADVNIAAVNYYFGDKTRLYIESVKSAHGKVVSGMQQPEWAEGTTPTQKLAAFIRMFVSRLVDPTRPRWHVQLMMREMAQPTAACAELVRDNIRPVAGILMNILEEILPPTLPPWKRFLVGISIIGQCVIHCQNRPILEQLAGPEIFSHFDADALADHISQFSLAALGLGKPLATREASS